MNTPLQLNPLISPQKAVEWFLLDMAEVSGFMGVGLAANMSPLSVYGTYRPVLTKPDPWYYAGVVALETSAITDMYTPAGAQEIMLEVYRQMDQIIGRKDRAASELAATLLGRLGIGSILMGRKVPDDKLGKTMLMLMGGEQAMKRIMPDDSAPKQIRAALRTGKPIWWKMFARRYRLTTAPDAVVETRVAIPYGAEAKLPDISANENMSDDPVLRLEALREALEKADLQIATPPGDGSDDIDDLLEETADDALSERGEDGKPRNPKAVSPSDNPSADDKSKSEENGALELDIRYRVD